MAYKILYKDRLDGFLESLSERGQVYAPVRKKGKSVWTNVTKAEDVDWSVENTEMSPKEFFFPQTECLLRFTNSHEEGSMIMHQVAKLADDRVLLNVRPCDAKAFRLLDRIFVQDEMTNDIYWKTKREHTLMIGMGCSSPRPECFCTSTGCGPFHEEGLDILLADLGDRILVKTLTHDGEEASSALPDASSEDVAQLAILKNKAEEVLPPCPGFEQHNAITQRSVLEVYGLPLWQRVYEMCLNCGTCTFVCPTCHCFDIQDEVKGKEGRRVRNWDTCMHRLFTEHASGHNPRGEKLDRVRQRFMHKFKYIPIKRDGELGCVGCGRCVRSCPTNIDVREIVRVMNEEAEVVAK